MFSKIAIPKKALDVPKNVARSIEPKIAFELSFNINAQEWITDDNFDSKNFFAIGLLLMFLLQNLSNDLIYAPDTSIYIWLLIIYFFNLSLRVDN